MRSDHLSKHVKTHNGNENIIGNGNGVKKENGNCSDNENNNQQQQQQQQQQARLTNHNNHHIHQMSTSPGMIHPSELAIKW
ncbi:hypothetical protein BLA29_011641 [Euroglyphus maynei]|uniref:C2H2-type domain-containing protein n=1 Tax=Euroglyphus maynei TaxID=6958 RepID=A0A1Y3BDZ5_EURMA|nr:hypothetical protein BLA29_011641 [Euroglyphus maynei]